MSGWEPKVGDWAKVGGRVGYWKVDTFDPQTGWGELAPETFPLRLKFSTNTRGEWTAIDNHPVTFVPDYVPTEGAEGKAARLDALVALLEENFRTNAEMLRDVSWHPAREDTTELLFFIATGKQWYQDVSAYNKFTRNLEEKHGQ